MSRNYFADQKTIEEFALNPVQSISQQIDSFYEIKERQFGFIFKPGAAYLEFVADGFRDKEQYEAAIELFLLALEEDDKNVKIYFNLADAYDKNGSFDLARKTFIKSLALLEEQKEKVSDNYYRDISKWANEKLNGYK